MKLNVDRVVWEMRGGAAGWDVASHVSRLGATPHQKNTCLCDPSNMLHIARKSGWKLNC